MSLDPIQWIWNGYEWSSQTKQIDIQSHGFSTEKASIHLRSDGELRVIRGGVTFTATLVIDWLRRPDCFLRKTIYCYEICKGCQRGATTSKYLHLKQLDVSREQFFTLHFFLLKWHWSELVISNVLFWALSWSVIPEKNINEAHSENRVVRGQKRLSRGVKVIISRNILDRIILQNIGQ